MQHNLFRIPLWMFFISLVTACTTAQQAQPTPPVTTVPTPVQPPKPTPFVQWDKKMIDIGAVKKGEKRTTFFEFTNTSGEVVQIDIVDACECTRVDYTHGAIKPGEKGRLDIVFDSKDKDAAETIGINVVFKNLTPDGNPRIEVVEYKFDLLK